MVAAGAIGVAAPTASAAVPWCGTPTSTDVPDAVASWQVHVVYAIPSDGTDRFGQFAPLIAADIAAIDDWWRKQDATRAPRWDLFASSGCSSRFGTLDLTDVRLRGSGSDYVPIETRGFALSQALRAVPTLANEYKKYLVYYDGPTGSQGACGQAQNSFPETGGTYAFVYFDEPSCGSVGSADYAAEAAVHELIHSLGALPIVTPGPPHACPGDPAHACDSNTDIMDPGGTCCDSLYQKTLDYGRDDYYGHGRPWWDVRNSHWLAHLDAQVALDVHTRGSGAVSSDLPGGGCSSDCTTSWDAGTPVTLTALPADGSRLVRWQGGCTGNDPSCSLTIDRATSVTAEFGPVQHAVVIAVSGKGRVVVASPATSCSRKCSVHVDRGAAVRLTAKPAAGSTFAGWSGACHGRRSTCTIAVADADLVVRAVFHRTR